MAKQKAIAIEYGDWEKSYAKLLLWITHMQNHSPGSYLQILHDDFIVGNMVSREHQAFKYYKRIIQVDGTHLYGKYRGTFLMATSQDGNGGVLPLAFAVVEGETLTAWSWFWHTCVNTSQIKKFVVANEALGWQPLHGYHVYCVQHIASNFNRKFNNAKQKQMLHSLQAYFFLSKFRKISSTESSHSNMD
ncbi:hypothetical protein GmHk_U059398 [Glycine max]|nr:hypothetical protein GmHk_U059398 [Glycine max]